MSIQIQRPLVDVPLTLGSEPASLDIISILIIIILYLWVIAVHVQRPTSKILTSKVLTL